MVFKSLTIIMLLINCAQETSWIAVIGGDTINIQLACDKYEIERGLMFRKSLAADSGMLFLFPESGIYPFWMKNTHIPLSIAFIDSQNTIIAIDTLIPLDTSLVFPPAPIIMALEVNISWFNEHGIKEGMDFTLIRND